MLRSSESRKIPFLKTNFESLAPMASMRENGVHGFSEARRQLFLKMSDLAWPGKPWWKALVEEHVLATVDVRGGDPPPQSEPIV